MKNGPAGTGPRMKRIGTITMIPKTPEGRADQAPPHDPVACGIDYGSSCAMCRTAWDAPNGGPPVLTPRQLWTWLTDRVPFLRRWRGTGEAAIELPVSAERKAELLAALCDGATREAVLTLLAPGITAIARQSGRAP
jgi:hypothetical protein